MNNLEKAINELLNNRPFYAHFFLNSKVKIVEDSVCPTAAACITKTSTMFMFGKSFIESLTHKELCGVIEHETLHFLFDHVLEFANKQSMFDAYVKNIAMDCAINQFIEGLPKFAVTLESLEKQLKKKLLPEQTWEYYYGQLQDFADKMKAAGIATLDDHSQQGKDGDCKGVGENGSLHKSVLRSTMDKAMQQSNGNVPDSVLKVYDSLCQEAKLPWKVILSNFVARHTCTTKQDTRKKRNRRFGITIAGKKKKRELVLSVCTDSSGSVSDESYMKFLDEIQRIAGLTSKTYLIDADCEVQNVDTLTKKSKIKRERHGHGGTAYQPAITRALELKSDIIIYFGDMDAADKPENPLVPVLWVIVGNQNPPADFGHVLRLE